ncbi:uncharacterized protein LOC122392224 [Amphibalanus amphitrite]|uniref:uncharacterized protein LOC122392224 n=1 Tax=Amphibalanus amphitrite TaxID=1232801 RepID=UPI001C907080|nr:uncharacterized protein LOC122392224 [Amphibalanus amphitrite]
MATGAAPARIQTFVFFDLEGTGLPSQPADYPVRIMELSLVAVQRPAGCGAAQPRRPAPGPGILEHLPPNERGRVTPKRPTREHGLLSWLINLILYGFQAFYRLAAAGAARARPRPRVVAGCATPPVSDDTSDEDDDDDDAPTEPLPVPTPPRVRNSLLLAVSPRKQIPAIVTDITELDNETLEAHSAFDRDLAEMLRAYLRRLPGPVCLVAHNGYRYDFPLLVAELLHAKQTWFDSSELLCVDSLAFFRAVAAGTDRPEPPRAPGAPTVYALNPTTLSCCHEAADDSCLVCNPGMWVSFDECDRAIGEFEFTSVGSRRAIRCRHADGARCVVCDHVPRYRRPPPRVRRRLFPEQGVATAGGGLKPSLALPDLYERRFGVPPALSHSAADDVEALLLLCQSHGERFFDWADRNRSPLREVKPMWTRRAARTHRVLPVW